MKKIQSTLLASSLIAALFFSTAYAATSNAEENPHKMRDLVESYQAENNEDSNITPMGKGMHSRMEKKGGPWKLLAELTGKNAKDIRQDRQATQNSKMIDQRKKDSGPIDFENEFDFDKAFEI